ncbi:MAG: SMP-30/gluconolactonase/LRE family protein [Actinomycetota bacterium]
MLNINSVSEIVSELAEGPLWHSETSSVIWTDIPGQSIHIAGLKSGISSSIRTPMMIGAVGLSMNNELIAATKNGFARITFDGNFESIADFLEPDLRMNDGKVDPLGRFWAGSLALNFEVGRGSLHVLNADSSVLGIERNLNLSNGMGWSPEMNSFYFIDSIPGLLFRYDYDKNSGMLSNKSVLVEFDSRFGIPDGLSITSDGLILIALWDGGRLELFDQSGRKVEQFSLPVSRPTSCCFAGDDYSTIIITTASQDIDRVKEPLAGRVLALSGTGLYGLASYRYG